MANKITTKRLVLREMTRDDRPALRRILQDPVAMAAYEHPFSEEEVEAWLQNQRRRYREDGFGLWGACLQDGGGMVGQCGITWQSWNGKRVPEVGYLFARQFWHKGLAAEAARACKEYAFAQLGFEEVFSIIRDTNIASLNVAIRNGMLVRGRMVKQYFGMEMPHLVFSVKRQVGKNDVECGISDWECAD